MYRCLFLTKENLFVRFIPSVLFLSPWLKIVSDIFVANFEHLDLFYNSTRFSFFPLFSFSFFARTMLTLKTRRYFPRNFYEYNVLLKFSRGDTRTTFSLRDRADIKRNIVSWLHKMRLHTISMQYSLTVIAVAWCRPNLIVYQMNVIVDSTPNKYSSFPSRNTKFWFTITFQMIPYFYFYFFL